jgi:hypothetical protein
MIQRKIYKRKMNDSNQYWCDYCSTPSKDHSSLTQHQESCRSYKKYKDVLFCCQRCGAFCTKDIKNLDVHLESCMKGSTLLNSSNLRKELEELRSQLAAEKTRSSIYLALLGSHTGINIEKLIETKDNEIHLFDVTPGTNVFLHERVQTKCLNKLEGSPVKIPEPQKHSRNYRRAPRYIESNPEPTTQARSLVIDQIDKRSKETLNQLNEDVANIIQQSCKELITQLKSSRTYTKLLRKLKMERSKLLGTLKLQEYIQVVRDHIKDLTVVLSNKQQSSKKVRTNIRNSLTPIEARVLRYQGYHETHLDGDCREKLEAVLRHGRIFSKEFKPYSPQELSDKLTNYSVAVFPIEKLIRWALINPYGFWNVTYLPWPKSTLEDPYSFYVLQKIKKGKRYWNMNCRLEDFTTDLIAGVHPYLIRTFRELYYDVFSDNRYRSNAIELSSFVAEDCEQLARNIILMSQPRKLCRKICKLLTDNCTYKHTKQDHFSLLGDDLLQRKRFQERETIEMVDTVKQLFDHITDEQAVNFFKSRNVA